MERNKDRDVSEKIALGMPSGAPSQDSLFDQRLFNQSKVSITRTQERTVCTYMLKGMLTCNVSMYI